MVKSLDDDIGNLTKGLVEEDDIKVDTNLVEGSSSNSGNSSSNNTTKLTAEQQLRIAANRQQAFARRLKHAAATASDSNSSNSNNNVNNSTTSTGSTSSTDPLRTTLPTFQTKS